jgi:hypothetical protein
MVPGIYQQKILEIVVSDRQSFCKTPVPHNKVGGWVPIAIAGLAT